MSRRKKRLVIGAGVVVVVGFLGFVLGGFFGVPWVVQSYVLPGISSNLNGEVRAKHVSCNPFRLRLTIDEIEVVDMKDVPVLKVDQVYANAGLASLWNLELYLQELDITRPNLNVDIAPSGESNVVEVVEPAVDLWARILRSPRITIDQGNVIDASATYMDNSLPIPFKHAVEDMDFEIKDFSTRPDQNNPYNCVIVFGPDERIEWQGQIMLNPLTTTGEFKLIGIDLARYFPYVKSLLNSELQSGKFDAEGSYTLSPVSEPKIIAVELSKIDVRDVAVTPMDVDAPYAELESLVITDVLADVVNHRIEVGGIDITEANANVNRLSDGGIDVLQWLMPNLDLTGGSNGEVQAKAEATEAADASPSTTTTDGRDVLPPHLQEARQRLKVALEGLIEAAQSKWTIAVGPISWKSFDVIAEDQTFDDPVRFTMTEFVLTTEPTGTAQDFITPFKAQMTVNDRTAVVLSGSIDPFQQNAAVDVDVDKLAISPAGAYLSGLLDATVNGDLSLDGKANLGIEGPLGVQLTYDGSVLLENFSVVKTGEPEPRLGWTSADLQAVKLNLAENSVEVGSLKVTAPVLAAGLDKDGKLDVFELLRDPGLADRMAEAAADANRDAPPDAPITLPVSLTVKTLALEGGAARLSDRTTTPETQLEIGNLNVNIQNIVSVREGQTIDEAASTDLVASMTLNETGSLNVQAQAKPFHKNANIKLDLKNFDIAAVNPHVIRYANAELSGALSVAGPVRFSQNSDGSYQLNYQGDIQVARPAVNVPGETEPRVSVEEIDLDQVDFTLQPMQVKADLITINKAMVTAGLKQDGTVDLLDLVKADRKHVDVEHDAKGTVGTMELQPPLQATIREIRVTDSRLDVSDKRLQTPVNIPITALQAKVQNVELAPGKIANLESSGNIAEAGSFTLKGSAEPIKPLGNTQLTLSLNKFPAQAIDAYLIEYLAHPAKSGVINVDLDTTLKQQQLGGDLSLMLDNFFLGDKVKEPGENAVDLPIKLGLGILRNNEKKINLENIPLTGDLSKPGVDVSGLIVDSLVKFVGNVISAPFSMLSKLAEGSDEVGDLKFVAFTPGSDTLVETAPKKLDVMAKILDKRPALNLGITGLVVDADIPALRKEQAIEMIQQTQAAGTNQTQSVPTDPQTVQVDDKTYRDWIRSEFEKMFPPALPAEGSAEPAPPAETSTPETPQTEETSQEPARPQVTITFEEREQAVLSGIVISETLKQTLAGKRARAVQVALVERGVASDRLSVMTPQQVDATPEAKDEQTPADATKLPRVEFLLK